MNVVHYFCAILYIWMYCVFRVGAFFFIVMNYVFGNMAAVDIFIKERALFMWVITFVYWFCECSLMLPLDQTWPTGYCHHVCICLPLCPSIILGQGPKWKNIYVAATLYMPHHWYWCTHLRAYKKFPISSYLFCQKWKQNVFFFKNHAR